MIPHYSYNLGYLQLLGWSGHAGYNVQVSLNYSANVFLVDSLNYEYYKSGHQYSYYGGHYSFSPVRLSVPYSGNWYLVVDNGGDSVTGIACSVNLQTIG